MAVPVLYMESGSHEQTSYIVGSPHTSYQQSLDSESVLVFRLMQGDEMDRKVCYYVWVCVCSLQGEGVCYAAKGVGLRDKCTKHNTAPKITLPYESMTYTKHK